MKFLIFCSIMILSNFVRAGDDNRYMRFNGTMTVPELSQSIDFTLTLKQGKQYSMMLKPHSASNACEFVVKRMGMPHAARGMNGNLYTDRVEGCGFNIEDSKLKAILDNIKLVDFTYSFDKKLKKLTGKAQLNSIGHMYHGKLTFQ